MRPLNHGCSLKKEGQLKVSKHESRCTDLCKGGASWQGEKSRQASKASEAVEQILKKQKMLRFRVCAEAPEGASRLLWGSKQQGPWTCWTQVADIDSLDNIVGYMKTRKSISAGAGSDP